MVYKQRSSRERERERFTFRNIFSFVFLTLLFIFLFNFNFNRKNVFAVEKSSRDLSDHDPYVFKFEIETTEDNEIYYVPTQGRVGGSFNDYNWDINWGDDRTEEDIKREESDPDPSNSGIKHTYENPGSYIIALT
ncbi:MAG: hypothetical protein LBJ93_03295, partial [Clostridiales bacterium]|nr:hypothetical protein [Clostridiales bacterium]